jgi:transcriptional regulator with GAF, ATPase, and Fis domain
LACPDPPEAVKMKSEIHLADPWVTHLREEFQGRQDSHEMVGRSSHMEMVMQQVKMVAATDATLESAW